ncbi:MAG: glycosyltransferase [Chloroflexi bacterium]|nr:glycosyltransferase [Chloroflexota bacterium]
MRILHIYKYYAPVLGGIENHIRILAEAQAARGHDVTVLVANPARRTTIEVMNGVRVIKAARWATVASTPISPALFWHTAQQRARQKADVAHLHFPHPPGEVANWLLHPAKRTVISYHSDVVRQASILRFYKPLMKRVLHRADALIYGSPPMKNSAYLQPHQAKLHLIPYGIPLDRFLVEPSGAEIERVRRQYPIVSAEQSKLLFVGRLRYYKGLNVLIDALPQIDAQLLVVGVGPMLDEWQAYTRSRGVADRVTWLGEVSDADLPALYHQSDLFVLPATQSSEAFGLVQVEAMASGIPTICTELGTGTSYVTQHEQTGLVVPPNDPCALAEGINRLLADTAWRKTLGAAARARAQAEFSVERMIDRVLDVYQTLLPA